MRKPLPVQAVVHIMEAQTGVSAQQTGTVHKMGIRIPVSQRVTVIVANRVLVVKGHHMIARIVWLNKVKSTTHNVEMKVFQVGVLATLPSIVVTTFVAVVISVLRAGIVIYPRMP